jgi:hypothetical protein
VAIPADLTELQPMQQPNAGGFTRDSSYAFSSLWELDGAHIIDMKTLEEVKRLPTNKPIGKYKVWNKIRKDEGTSH